MTEFVEYRSEAEIEEVVRKFEACEYKPEEFVHARHLTVAAFYFLRLPGDGARERMRAGLKRFIRHHGKNGYHETITEFWLGAVGREARDLGQAREGGLVECVNRVVAELGNKELIYRFYSRERLGSAEAKAGWVEGDLDWRDAASLRVSRSNLFGTTDEHG